MEISEAWGIGPIKAGTVKLNDVEEVVSFLVLPSGKIRMEDGDLLDEERITNAIMHASAWW